MKITHSITTSLRTAVCALAFLAAATVSYAAVGGMFSVDGIQYEILTEAAGSGTVAVYETSNAGPVVVVIPKTVWSAGHTYTVTEVAVACGYFSPNTALDLSACTSLAVIHRDAFANSLLSSLKLSGCTALTTIEEGAFANSKITALDLSGCTALTTIDSRAFEYCTYMLVADLSECTSLTSIGPNAFDHTHIMTTLQLPASLANIGSNAFQYALVLRTIVYHGATEPTFGAGAFTQAPALARVLYVPSAAYGFAPPRWGTDVTIFYHTDVVPVGDSVKHFTLENGTAVDVTLTGVPAEGGVLEVKKAATFAPPSKFKKPALLAQECIEITCTAYGYFATLNWTVGATLPAGTNKAFRYAGGNLTEYDVTPVGKVVTVSGLTGFSDWYVGELAAVPVSMSSFEVE